MDPRGEGRLKLTLSSPSIRSYLAFLFDAAPKNRNLERRGSTASARPSILGLGSKLKRAKLPKDVSSPTLEAASSPPSNRARTDPPFTFCRLHYHQYSAALIEQLVGDLKSTSKEQGAEAKQWVATVSRFLALLEAKKALKKERNWSELLSGTSALCSSLGPDALLTASLYLLQPSRPVPSPAFPPTRTLPPSLNVSPSSPLTPPKTSSNRSTRRRRISSNDSRPRCWPPRRRQLGEARRRSRSGARRRRRRPRIWRECSQLRGESGRTGRN